MVRLRRWNASRRDINGIPLVQEFDYSLCPSPILMKLGISPYGDHPIPIPFHHPHITTHLVFICEICRNQLQLFQFCTLKSIKYLLQAGFRVMAAWMTNRDTLIFVVNCTFFLHERSNCNRGVVTINESRTW